MPYIEDRLVHDADAHIMETPNWLRDYADPAAWRREMLGKILVPLRSFAPDLLVLSVLPPPAVWGADTARGSSQRFGVQLREGRILLRERLSQAF